MERLGRISDRGNGAVGGGFGQGFIERCARTPQVCATPAQLTIFAALFLVCLFTAVPAEAQIYTWRDSSGHLVLSTTKPQSADATDVVTYAVAGPTALKTTNRPASVSAQTRYDDLIREHADLHGVSPELVRAVIQAESGFNPFAISSKGAMGLMQLMPATARELGVSDPFHPAENIRGGVTYLAQLLARYGQNLQLALAAYNAGPLAVERYGAIPPYKETQNYVKKITGATVPLVKPPDPTIYKWVDTSSGEPITRYSNVKPKDVDYEVVGRR